MFLFLCSWKPSLSCQCESSARNENPRKCAFVFSKLSPSPRPSPLPTTTPPYQSLLPAKKTISIICSTAHLKLPNQDIGRLTFSCQLASEENIVRGGAGTKEVRLLYVQTKAHVTCRTSLRAQQLSEASMISSHLHMQRSLLLLRPPKKEIQKHMRLGLL